MGIIMDTQNDKSILSIDGELTIYTVQEYKKSLAEKFVVDKVLEMDLTGVDEIDTSGLQLLAAMSKELFDNGSEMKITQASDVVTEALESSRLMTNMKCDSEGENHES